MFKSIRARAARGWLVPIVVVAISVCIAACGGSGKSTTSGGSSTKAASSSSTTANGGTTGSYTRAELEAIVQKGQTAGTWQGPESSPPPAKNKKIFIVMVTEAAQGSIRDLNGIEEMAKAIGWHYSVCNGQGEVPTMAACIEQGVNEHYDGIVLQAINAVAVAPQIAAARKAGIPVVDFSNFTKPGPTSINANVGYDPAREAPAVAAWTALNSGGKAQILEMVDPEFGIATARAQYFNEYLKKYCSGCAIAKTTQFQATQLGTDALASQIQGILQANPNINYVWAPFDSSAVSAVSAVMQAGLKGKVKVISYEGNSQNLAYIRSGQAQVADEAYPAEWGAGQTVDVLNRIFNHVPVTFQDAHLEPPKLLVASNLPPAGQSYTGDYNWLAKYKQLWADAKK